MKQIFVKLPSGSWIKIKGRLSGLNTGRSSKKTTYTLLAESIDKPELNIDKPIRVFYVLSTRVTKYIHKLLEYLDNYNEEICLVIEYFKPEVYRVKVYSDEKDIAYKIALDMNIVKKT